MDAKDMPFSKMINVDQGAREHFHVPKYQREYSWKRAQWDQLLVDIEDNETGYFMGSIICVNDAQTITPGGEIIYEVVDGQQRLTTLSLLLAAIHAKLVTAAPSYAPDDQDAREELKDYQRNIRAKIVKKKNDPRPGELGGMTLGRNVYFLRVKPSEQNHNLSDFLYLMGEAGLLDRQPKPPYCGNRQLARAFAYFDETVPADVPHLIRLLDKINQLMFVQITVGSQSDAFTLFESLNNRGVPLSAMDIIKNKMLAQMERKHSVDTDVSFERWQELVNAVPDANDQERFLRQFYNTFKHRKEIKVDKATRATRSLIIRIYENLINRDAALIFDELIKGATLYGKLLGAEIGPRLISDGLTELDRISSAPAYHALLFLFSMDESKLGGPRFLGQVVDLLGRYFIRRNVTDKPPTRQIDQAFINLVESCASRIESKRVIDFDWFAEELVKQAQPASLADFRAALSGDIYASNSAMARYILIQLDQLHHSREYKPDLWARDDKGHFVWTVEHVLPQAEKLPDHWVRMIGGGNRPTAIEIQEKWVHKLGNLTLSGYNSDLATAPFEKKQKLSKDRNFLGHRINIGYQNGLFLNSVQYTVSGENAGLADATRWNADSIEARTKLLVEMALKANLLPGEKI